MLRTQTVAKGTLDLIKRFMSDDKFNDFNLVGGTALALKIGHRLSVDIDLFSTTPFDAKALAEHLAASYAATEIRTLTNGVFCFVDNIKIDLIAHQYSLVDRIEMSDGIRIVSLLDIGAMKLNAIFGSGKRYKDFVDMYSLLEQFTLNELLDACQQKYPDLNINMVKHSLIHFEDVILAPIDFIGPEVKWSTITDRLRQAFYNPHICFGLSKNVKPMENKIPSHKGKGKRPR